MPQIGAHVSAAGGVWHAPLNAQAEGLETFQMFSRSPQSFRCPPLNAETVEQFLINVKAGGFKNYYIHAPYLVNLASSKETLRRVSVKILREELERGSRLKVRGVMFHTGSAAAYTNRAEAIAVAIKSLNEVLAGYKGNCLLLLENAAGSGSILGCSFAELAQLYRGIKQKQRVGFCLDTQHAFASGYDLRTSAAVNKTVKEIDRTIGLNKLIVIQANDSKSTLNSKIDRHEHIKYGQIGAQGFRALLHHPKLRDLDFILETPAAGRVSDVVILKRLRAKP